MAQGKLKVKTKVPTTNKNKTQKRKGSAITKRANCPVQSKKKKTEETAKLKQRISRSVNKAVEDEMRARATDIQKTNKKSLTKAQQAVVDHHNKASTS